MRNSKLKTISFISVLSVILLPNTVFGVTMSFEPPNVVSNQAEAFTTTLVLTADNESINAVEGTLIISKEFGSDITVSDSGSLVTYWVTRPAYDPATHTVKFSGTIPGGFEGQAGILFSVILPPRTGGSLENAVVIGEANSYLNDGMGTQAKVNTKQFSLTSDGTAPVNTAVASQLYVAADKADNIPPESFSPQLEQSDLAFDGQWFMSFSTTDKQSGVSYYEVQETRSGRLDAGQWRRANSPYVLQDQDLHSYIYVVAVDRQGNERMIKVFPRNPLTWWQQYQRDIGIGLGVLILITAGLAYHHRQNRIRLTGK